MKIYKYQLPHMKGEFHLTAFPIEQVMRVDVVNGIPFMWCLIDDNKREVNHIVHALHTGDEDIFYNVLGTEFIGTALLDNGNYILHYYIDEL
jgi:hypothetical protein